MKKILKGFTLIELIIVMAILTILMAAIMQMFKPIRETYVDSTLYENQRTAQSGIIQYINESLRYATDVGIYNIEDVTDITGAVEEFAKAYCNKNPSANQTTVEENAEVIIIDNTNGAYAFNGDTYTGRLLRRKASTIGTSTINENVGTGSTAGCRIALGPAYYGNNNYAIKISKPTDIPKHVAVPPASLTAQQTAENNAADLEWSANEGIKVTVASTSSYGYRQLQNNESFVDASNKFNNKLIHTEGLVVCPNLSKLGGLFDVHDDTDRAAIAAALAAGSGGGGGGGGGGGTPPPTPVPGGSPSSNGNSVSINSITSDDTVGPYAGGGAPGAPGGAPGAPGGAPGAPGGYSDSAKYNETTASSINTKVYIVFLTQ